DAQKILVQPNGKILIAGQTGTFPDTDLLLARYDPDGTKEPTFGGGAGVVTVDFLSYDDMWGLNRMDDGRIVVVGYAENTADNFHHAAVARFTPDGQLDHTFSTDGKVTTAIPGFAFTDAWRSVVQPNGK